jgi:hypothetical protein
MGSSQIDRVSYRIDHDVVERRGALEGKKRKCMDRRYIGSLKPMKDVLGILRIPLAVALATTATGARRPIDLR